MSEELFEQRLSQFMDTLASGAPTPGGGSVAALTGAMAAGLITMVCDLTIGKRQYADFEEEARALRERSEALRAELQTLAQTDIDMFTKLSAAYKLPRTTDADAALRRAAIQNASKQAAEAPLRTARAVADLLPLCLPLARMGNRLAVSDIGVAALLIRAAVPAALLNVEINLGILQDQGFTREARARMEDLTIGLEEEIQGVLVLVQERMSG
ncbi:MAG: cyclodeaminase/cyclohydrolase family protein [Roseiflexaceae bacterium]